MDVREVNQGAIYFRNILLLLAYDMLEYTIRSCL